MKKVSYFLNWMLAVFGVSVFLHAILNGIIIAYYNGNFPPMPPNMMLLLWIGILIVYCTVEALLIDGVSKKQNIGGVLFPLHTVIINQALASAAYAVLGAVCRYNKMFYIIIHFAAKVIGGYAPEAITDRNEYIWFFALCLIHTVIFTAVSLRFYFIERRRQADLLKKGLEDSI